MRRVTGMAVRGIVVLDAQRGRVGLMYDREAERVLVFLTRRTLDVTIAADMTAETFALAFASWSRLQGRSAGEVRAWLFTVAERQVSRYLRRARVERRAVRRLG